MVRELSVEHVKRDRAGHGICTWREYKFRLPVNELRDQPRRSNSVDLRAWARQPCFALVLLRTEHRELSRTTAAFGATEQHRDVVPTCTVEEIDFAKFTELSREAFQFRRRCFRIHFLAPPDETLKRFSQFSIIFGTSIIKDRDHLLFGQALDFLRSNKRRITSIIADLLCQPLKLLVLRGLIGEEIRRSLDLHCTHLFQTPPHRHALGVAICRQTEQQQKP